MMDSSQIEAERCATVPQTSLEVLAMSSTSRAYQNSEQRWDALCRRDRAADGRFVYAVTTTGVFCRPACASRRPLRKNVEFFDSPAQAARAGYRSCKRCSPSETPTLDPTMRAIVKACRLLEGETIIRSDEAASEVGLSPSHFVRAFKKHVGVTPQAYRRRVLAERAKDELVRSRSVTGAAYAAGYSSASRFYEGAGRELGMTPRQAHKGALGQRVQYVVRSCSLGYILLAWTERGACDVCFDDSERAAVSALLERFPRATCARGDAPPWIDRVIAAVERPQSLDVPLDIQGTAFQQRVWGELRRIPAGETRTYAEVARALGADSATRAVARAIASNRLALLVPCHRVIRGDGAISGYRWHPKRKQELLRREAERG
jgi:AraC family transcriptional regulator, regulatory protein of adaptative response / methylated-DNA-[protein]-cysteine methyltransferase